MAVRFACFGVAFLALLGLGCAASRTPVATLPARPQGTWILTHLVGTALDSSQAPRGFPVLVLDLEKDQYSGTDGCNRIRGTVRFAGADSLRFEPGFSTRMACQGDLDSRYREALYQATSYRWDSDALWLMGSGTELLRFRWSESP